MKSAHLVRQSLTQYWRTNLAVLLGVATAVTVLAGALLVGSSVRGSLRDLVLQNLGQTDFVITGSGFFREQLAADIREDPSFAPAFQLVSPVIVATGLAIDQSSGRRVLGVQVYGVDDHFWRLVSPVNTAGADSPFEDPRDVVLSTALGRDLQSTPGATILVRIPRPSEIPADSLHGRKEDLGQTLRFTMRGTLDPSRGGSFSLRPQQGDVRAVFIPLTRLQRELGLTRTVNALLVAQKSADGRQLEALQTLVRRHVTLEDVGLKTRALDRQAALSVEGGGSLVTDAQAAVVNAAAKSTGLTTTPSFTYLANELRSGDRATPYSLITAIDLRAVVPDFENPHSGTPPILLNQWTARDLGASAGDPLTLTYYVWEDPGQLVERRHDFRVAGIVPMAGIAADRDFAPEYPGITDADNVGDWDPPFPIDLKRIRPVDEEYWRDHRTTPKAFVPLEIGQTLWRSRYGALTTIRVGPLTSEDKDPYLARLRSGIDPFAVGFQARDVRTEGLGASRGATDFGEYFTYFSFFLVVSALLLAVLFFKLGVEQRGREIGLLRAVGFTPGSVRRLFLAEAALLSTVGSLIGMLGAVAYGQIMMYGLRTWWVGAVGTTALTLHVSPLSLVAGAVGGVIAALLAIWWTLRRLGSVSERSLLAGDVRPLVERGSRSKLTGATAAALFFVGLLLVVAGVAGWLGSTGAFFGAGGALLASSLSFVTFTLSRTPSRPLAGHGWPALTRLGFRHATHRPGRTILAVAVMAFATFVLISVGAFRKDDVDSSNPASGTGGYALVVDSMLPVVNDPNSQEGRALFGLPKSDDVRVEPFRVLPGDDASCLNLYAPQQPRIVAVSQAFVADGRFAFQNSIAETAADRANPWRLLERPIDEDVIPVIADANSMTYVLHRSLGGEIVLMRGDRQLRLRLVAALSDSIFQGELLMSEANFLRLFPERVGFQRFLVQAPDARRDELASLLEDRLSDYGADATSTAGRLGEFHKVENTYLSTFQALGGLGLLLGTIGLAAILLRNAFERRRELALLGAVGYERRHLVAVVVTESLFLLAAGIVLGAACAVVAIAPAALERGSRLPVGAGQWLLLLAVFATGLFSSLIATRLAVQARLLNALRGE